MNVTKPSVEIIDMKDYDEMIRKIEKIGRVCYKSEGNITEESAERFIRNILKRGHESVIEHEAVTVRMICDRGITHEIVRHRIASYSQESTRYCNYSGDKFGNEITVIDIASLKTEIVVTMNLRSWRNFFRLRCDSHAHPQMREVANIALDLFKKRLPIFFDDID